LLYMYQNIKKRFCIQEVPEVAYRADFILAWLATPCIIPPSAYVKE